MSAKSKVGSLCSKGHKRSGKNLIVKSRGELVCKRCNSERNKIDEMKRIIKQVRDQK